MKISVAELFRAEQKDPSIKHSFETDIDSDEIAGFTPLSALKGTLQLFRVDDDIVVLIKEATIEGEALCARCLGKIQITVNFSDGEQTYSLEPLEDWGEEEFIIDTSTNMIDVLPFLQQELLIHIPDVVKHAAGKCDPKMKQKAEKFTKSKNTSPFADLGEMIAEHREELE